MTTESYNCIFQKKKKTNEQASKRKLQLSNASVAKPNKSLFTKSKEQS